MACETNSDLQDHVGEALEDESYKLPNVKEEMNTSLIQQGGNAIGMDEDWLVHEFADVELKPETSQKDDDNAQLDLYADEEDELAYEGDALLSEVESSVAAAIASLETESHISAPQVTDAPCDVDTVEVSEKPAKLIIRNLPIDYGLEELRANLRAKLPANIIIADLTAPTNGRSEVFITPASSAEAAAKIFHESCAGDATISCIKLITLDYRPPAPTPKTSDTTLSPAPTPQPDTSAQDTPQEQRTCAWESCTHKLPRGDTHTECVAHSACLTGQVFDPSTCEGCQSLFLACKAGGVLARKAWTSRGRRRNRVNLPWASDAIGKQYVLSSEDARFVATNNQTDEDSKVLEAENSKLLEKEEIKEDAPAAEDVSVDTAVVGEETDALTAKIQTKDPASTDRTDATGDVDFTADDDITEVTLDRIEQTSQERNTDNPGPQHAVSVDQGAFGFSQETLDKLQISLPIECFVSVSNLPAEDGDTEVRQLLALAGTVVSIERRGHVAYVEMGHPVEAVQAISMLHSQFYHNRALTVRLHRPKRVSVVGGTSNGASKLPSGLQTLGKRLQLDCRYDSNLNCAVASKRARNGGPVGSGAPSGSAGPSGFTGPVVRPVPSTAPLLRANCAKRTVIGRKGLKRLMTGRNSVMPSRNGAVPLMHLPGGSVRVVRSVGLVNTALAGRLGCSVNTPVKRGEQSGVQARLQTTPVQPKLNNAGVKVRLQNTAVTIVEEGRPAKKRKVNKLLRKANPNACVNQAMNAGSVNQLTGANTTFVDKWNNIVNSGAPGNLNTSLNNFNNNQFSPNITNQSSSNQKQRRNANHNNMGNMNQKQTGNMNQKQTGNMNQNQTGNMNQNQIGNMNQNHIGNMNQNQTGSMSQNQSSNLGPNNTGNPNQNNISVPNNNSRSNQTQPPTDAPNNNTSAPYDPMKMMALAVTDNATSGGDNANAMPGQQQRSSPGQQWQQQQAQHGQQQGYQQSARKEQQSHSSRQERRKSRKEQQRTSPWQDGSSAPHGASQRGPYNDNDSRPFNKNNGPFNNNNGPFNNNNGPFNNNNGPFNNNHDNAGQNSNNAATQQPLQERDNDYNIRKWDVGTSQGFVTQTFSDAAIRTSAPANHAVSAAMTAAAPWNSQQQAEAHQQTGSPYSRSRQKPQQYSSPNAAATDSNAGSSYQQNAACNSIPTYGSNTNITKDVYGGNSGQTFQPGHDANTAAYNYGSYGFGKTPEHAAATAAYASAMYGGFPAMAAYAGNPYAAAGQTAYSGAAYGSSGAANRTDWAQASTSVQPSNAKDSAAEKAPFYNADGSFGGFK